MNILITIYNTRSRNFQITIQNTLKTSLKMALYMSRNM